MGPLVSWQTARGRGSALYTLRARARARMSSPLCCRFAQSASGGPPAGLRYVGRNGQTAILPSPLSPYASRQT
eukprot:1398784-Lingulodinium_polyedra.AAC.1